jgi:hypothetical protein
MSYNYPEIYHSIYPKVVDCINRHMGSMPLYGLVPDENIEQMVDEIYNEMLDECPEIGQDPGERRSRSSRYRSLQRPFYGRSRLLRDFIVVLLISELINRSYPYERYSGWYGYKDIYGFYCGHEMDHEPWY